jgi:hypothetical protein
MYGGEAPPDVRRSHRNGLNAQKRNFMSNGMKDGI